MAGPETRGVCRDCGALTRWAITARRRRIPLEIEANPERGNVLICDHPEQAARYGVRVGRAVVLGPEAAARERAMGELELYLPHKASCPARVQNRHGAPRELRLIQGGAER